MMSPYTVVVIRMVAEIAQEARILFETIRNPAQRLYLAAARATGNDYAMAKINTTSMEITDWALVCA